jgi:hypothetical protein
MVKTLVGNLHGLQPFARISVKVSRLAGSSCLNVAAQSMVLRASAALARKTAAFG